MAMPTDLRSVTQTVRLKEHHLVAMMVSYWVELMVA
jgi:hypothetical protein